MILGKIDDLDNAERNNCAAGLSYSTSFHFARFSSSCSLRKCRLVFTQQSVVEATSSAGRIRFRRSHVVLYSTLLARLLAIPDKTRYGLLTSLGYRSLLFRTPQNRVMSFGLTKYHNSTQGMNSGPSIQGS
jgi:hypothetical protein